jgi:NADH-quinone oxidoreductase subunit N
MNGVNARDLALLVPELILVGTVLVLILLARRIGNTPVASVATIVAAVGAALAAGWAGSESSQTGFAGMIILDGYSQFFKVLVGATAALATLLSVKSVEREQVPRAEYHALLLLAATGMMLAVSAIDLITLYLGLELMTLCSYILVGVTVEKPASNEAAIKYLLLGSFASILLLAGISLTYGVTGATDFVSVSTALSRISPGSPLPVVAIVLVGAGLAFKVAAVPFHSWAPDAYQGAMAPVAGFLAAGSKAVGLAALGRVFLVAFGSWSQLLEVLLVALAGLSIIVGSVIAVSQTDMKRLLAYSSIAHAGYALLGLVGGTADGIEATMTYAFFYVFMTLGAFGVVIALGDRGEELDGYQGLSAERPGMAILMLVFLLSLTGIPPTAGFTAKFVVILSAVRAGHAALAILAVACSVVTAFVYMRVAVLMYMRDSREPAPSHLPMAVSAALAVALLVTLVGGISPESVVSWAVSP